MNSRTRDQLIGSPTFSALTGERRKAFIRQWIISGALFVVLAAISMIVLAIHSRASVLQQAHLEHKLIISGVILYGLQLLYALIKRETIWQLRLRELQRIKNDRTANEREVLDFMQEHRVKDNSS